MPIREKRENYASRKFAAVRYMISDGYSCVYNRNDKQPSKYIYSVQSVYLLIYIHTYRIAGKFGGNYICRFGLPTAEIKYWRNLNLPICDCEAKFHCVILAREYGRS